MKKLTKEQLDTLAIPWPGHGKPPEGRVHVKLRSGYWIKNKPSQEFRFEWLDRGSDIVAYVVAVDERRAPERAWLLEWKAPGCGPKWWGFDHTPVVRNDWCADVNNAIRFARKVDAERMRLHHIAVVGLTGCHDFERQLFVTEHEWV